MRELWTLAESRRTADITSLRERVGDRPSRNAASPDCTSRSTSATSRRVIVRRLMAMFVALGALLLVEGIKNGPQQRDMVIAMLIIFAFNVLVWCFFELAGSSFTFLAE